MKRIIPWVVIVALLALTVWKLASNKRTQEEQVYRFDRNAPVHVVVDTVRSIALSEGLRYSGTIEAVSEGKVMAEVPGRVVAVPVQEGQWVEKGKVIARLDGDLLRRQLSAAQVQVEGLEKDQKRYTILAAQDAVQGVQLEKTELALQAAKIQLGSLQEQVQRTEISAPISGYIAQLFVDVGTVLNPSMPVAMISDDRTLELAIAVPGSELDRFRKDQHVDVLASGSGMRINGIVSSVGSRGDMSHNFPVRIALNGADTKGLKPGMAATVRSVPTEAAKAPTIPANAIIGSSLEPEVYVLQNGRAMRKRITTGAGNAEQVAVVDGLNVGDVVVTSGFINLSDGVSVKTK